MKPPAAVSGDVLGDSSAVWASSAPATAPAVARPISRRTGEGEGKKTAAVIKAYYKASGGALLWTALVVLLLLGHALWAGQTWSLKKLSERAAEETAQHARFGDNITVAGPGLPFCKSYILLSRPIERS
jgi:hypothetical protein